MTRPTDSPLSWAALLHGLASPGLVALVVGCLFSLGLSSAAAGNDSRLEQIGYREALSWFHSQKYDSSGAWLCGYSLAREDYSVAPKAPRLLVEVDQRFLYLKTAGQLVELTGAAQGPERSEYQNTGAHIRVTLNILKRNNFSEYQESHDRQVLARIEMNDQVETLTLKGQSCGTLNLAGLGLLIACAATPALADESNPGKGCYGYLTELVRSSDFPYRDFTTPEHLKLLIDRDDGDQLSLQLFYETSGSGTIGWVRYDVPQQALWNVSIDPEEPQALKFDQGFARAYASCLEAR